MENLSDGKSDGFVIFYLKEGKLQSVLLTKEQAEMLDLTLHIAFGKTSVITMPVVRYAMLQLMEDD